MAVDRPLGYCIVGAGNIGKVHAQAIAHVEHARLVAVADTSIEQAQALCATCEAAWYTDYREAVARPDVDVVCICTPSGAHMEPALAAAEAGKHLVVEKPLDRDVPRASRILTAARERGLKATCILPYRFNAGSRRAREAIVAGRLGRITLAEARVPWWRTQAYYDTGGWRGTAEKDGGGALINQALHAIDLMLWLAGPTASAFGHTARLAHRMETEDTGVAVLSLASGGLGVITGGTGCWPGQQATIGIYGDRGTIILHEGRITTWQLVDAAPGEAEALMAEDQGGGSGSKDPMAIGFEMHRRQLADMSAAILADRQPTVTAADGLHCLEVICAIYESAKTGKVVEFR